MQFLALAKAYLESNFGPIAPGFALTLAVWAFVYFTRKFAPKFWTFLDAHSPENVVLSKLVQGLPAVMLGALVTAGATGLDPLLTVVGAVHGALAPLLHELMKKYRGAVPQKRLGT